MSKIKLLAKSFTTQTAGSALLCSLLAQYLTPTFRQGGGQQESEVLSEAVCWIALPVLFRLFGASRTAGTSRELLPHYHSTDGGQHQQHRQAAGSVWSPGLVAWLVASGVSVACWFKAEVGSLGLFVSLVFLRLMDSVKKQNQHIGNRSSNENLYGMYHLLKTGTADTYTWSYIQPMITPILLLVERKLQSGSNGWSGSSTKASTEEASPYHPHSALAQLLPMLATSLLSIWATLDGNTVRTALSTIPTLALLAVYIPFAASTSSTLGNHSHLKFIPSVGDLEGFVTSGRISLRVVGLLGLVLVGQIWSFGFPTGINFATVLLAGLASAGSWYFTIRTIHCANTGLGNPEKRREHDHGLTQPVSGTSWTIATLISTFSLVASRDPSIQSSHFQALSQVLASLLLLGQIIHNLPRQAKAKSVLWTFALVSIIPYLYHGFVLRQINSTSPSWTPARPHPAEALIQKAGTDFDKLLERQSKTYEEAVNEYKRRYGISPPPGFDKWYELAIANSSPIIDEFETIFENMSPFLKLSGKEISRIVNKASKMPNIELWDCTFTSKDDKAMTQCIHPSRKFDRHISTMFDQMLHDLQGLWLPDIRFLVNHLDEPRVMFPLQPEDPRVAVETYDLSHKPTWDKLTRLCHQSDTHTTNRTYNSYPEVNTYSLPFVTDRHSEQDICQHPEYRTLNGLFTSPTSFNLISGFVPVLSTGAPSTMGDILIPSPAYSESQFRYHPASDPPWSEKHNNLYWAGSNTGGFASDDTAWPFFQRQRFVSKAQNLQVDSQSHTYLTQLASPESNQNQITTLTTNFLNPTQYDVSFTQIFQCTPSQCRSQRSFFHRTIKSRQDPDTALKSKIAFDLDGNGISGRYYKLLSSNSLPFKQTLLREWHDERLWGWVHYVPVSQSLGELPELVRYFSGETGRGQENAKGVADRGKDWVERGLREVDRSLYLYRVLLELGRVMDLTREPSRL
ncbi:hypothetical protein QBC37DRAFT_429048 [Rhypophila decipiens]|uniref:Glycosyl transferase CAP10 domain-containing protein n=1 Tax=Rhypophila decipiens TaxID=261697 RepID=A0AAN7B4S7_9PEZI|nr:hypothetical protein QBC37DRAFT_429048 [Rhypophila decipiens]